MFTTFFVSLQIILKSSNMMYIIRLFWDFIQKYKWTMVFYMICVCLSFPIESVILPQLYSSFFDNIRQHPTQKVFLYYFGLIFLLVMMVNICNVISNLIEAEYLPEWKGFFMNWIFEHLLKIYENKMTDIELGKLIVDLVILPRLSKELLMEFTTWTLPRGLAVLFIHVYFFLVDFRLGVLSLLTLIFYSILSYFTFIKCSPLAEQEHSKFEDKMQTTQDRLSNTFSIYSMGNVQQEIEQYMRETGDYIRKDKSKMSCLCTANIYTSFYIIATMMSINGFTTYLFFQKKISFATLMSVYMIVMYYIPSITSINNEIPMILMKCAILQNKDPFLEQLYQLIPASSFSSSSSLPKQDKTLQSGNIDIRDLTFSYSPESKHIFNHFHLNLRDKSKLAIMGPSGSGKSSLIKLIMGYYPVPDDTIYIDGLDINRYELNTLRQQISYVNQNTKLFSMTLLENICYGSETTGTCSRGKIESLIRQIGVQEVFRNVELDDNVGIEGGKLSGGQRQMVHLLRCILRKNRIVILDEPTSALDADLKAVVIRAIQVLSRQSTLIIITHDESLLFLVDRVIRMNE